MSDIITVRAKNILGTEETDVQIRANATVGQLLQKVALQFQINTRGATIMYRGQEFPPEQPLLEVGVRDGDAVIVMPGPRIVSNDIITVRVKNILGTEETDVQIDAHATVGQLLQQAAPQLQINPQGATIMYQGHQLPPEQPLYKAGVRDLDAVMIAPGSIVGGGGGPLFEIASQVVTPIVSAIVANYIYDRLRGIDLKELTKRLLIGIFSQNKHLIPAKQVRYETISEKVAELMHQELTEWKRISEDHGVKILEELLSKRNMGVSKRGISVEELRSIINDDLELAETIGKMATSGKVQITIQLRGDILQDTENLLLEILQKSEFAS